MKLPWPFKRSKCYVKDGKLILEVSMNKFEKICFIVWYFIKKTIRIFIKGKDNENYKTD